MIFKEVTINRNTIYQQLNHQLYGKNISLFTKDAIAHFAVFDNEEPLCFGSMFRTGNSKVVTLGNFQCVERIDVAHYFFKQLQKQLKNTRYKTLVGPMHGSTWFPYRFSTNLEQPFFTEFEHKSYYPSFWVANNFTIEQTYYSNIAPVDVTLREHFESNYFTKNNYRIEQLTEETNEQTLRDIYCFTQEQFSRNHFYTELTFEEFLPIGKQYIQRFKGNFSQLIYEEDTLVGLFLACEDLNTSLKRAVVRTIARKKGQQYSKIPQEMCKYFYLQLIKKGFNSQIHAYFNENNPSGKISKQFGGSMLRKHCLYSISL